MPADKKLAAKRVVIFTVIAYAATYLFIFFGFDGLNAKYILINHLVMMMPALANILTRVITKDKSETYLKINFKGNGKYYLFAIVFPVVCSLIMAIIEVLFLVKDYNFSESLLHESAAKSIYLILGPTAVGAVIFFICWGEEFGWRAYLTPQLEKLMGRPAALTVSGVIWGMWHAPLVAEGLNFGTGYKFFPYAGFIAMCVSCIFYGIILSWLTDKTGSILPAAICHSCVDMVFSSFTTLLIPIGAEYKVNDFWLGVIAMVVIEGIICIAVMIFSGKKSRWLLSRGK